MSGGTTGLGTEDGSTPSASGVLSVTDVDTGENTVLAAEMPGSYGAFAVDSDGNWTYNLTAGDTDAVQSLGAGDTLTENFTVRSADGTAVETVTVTIEGTNDAAQITGDATGTVIEDAGPVATGQLLVSDADAGEASFVMSEMAGTYGAFFIDDGGNWTYNLTANDSPEVQALGEGDSLTETFMVKTADGTTQAVNVTIAGSNDAAQVSGETAGAVTEDTSLAATGQLSVTDVDAGEASFVAAEVAGSYGAFVVDQSGNWTYNLTANDSPEVQGLNAGDTLTETFTVKTADGTTQDVTVTINGSNDATAVTITGDTAGTVVEDGAATSSGQLATEAGAADNLSLAAQTATTAGDFAAASLDGAYGTFTMDDTGNWTYDLTANNSPVVQALGDGDTLTETFTVQTADGSASQEIKVTIAGTNDAPVVTAPTFSTDQDVALTINASDLLSQATDIEGDALTAQNLTVDTGTLTDNGDGSWTYTPPSGWDGTANFSYDVFDGSDATQADSTITVNATAQNLNLIEGTNYNQTITGTSQDDLIIGHGGNDTMYGEAGDDVFEITTGDGLDVVSGGEGNDTLRGTSADDDIQLNQFWDANRVENIDGGAGNDVLHLRYHGDFSQTTISNLERIEGSSFRNYIYGSQGDDVISGAGGDDDLRGNAGDDVFLKTTGDGFDTIAGGEGFDTIQGTDADDRTDLYSYTGDN